CDAAPLDHGRGAAGDRRAGRWPSGAGARWPGDARAAMRGAAALISVFALFGAAGIAHADNSWTTNDYDHHAGDFDGDGRSDILYIARDPARLSGIALADETGFNTALQTWGNAYLGIPWSGGHYNVVVGDFNGDGRDDLFLQRRTPGDHYLILTEEGGIGAI